MSVLTLWQLDAHYVAVLNQVEQNEGELTEELEQQLDDAIADIVIKQDGYIKVIDTLNTLEDQAKQWRDKMNAKIKTIQNQKDRLKDALIYHLKVIGTNELKGELGKVKLMASKKVGTVDETKLPAKYKTIIKEVKIDKKQLLADLKIGKVKGAGLEEVEYLRIYV